MQLRIARVEDIDGVLELHYRYQIDSIAEEEKKDGFVTTPFTSGQLRSLIEEEQGLFIALEDERVIAYVMAASWRFWSAWPMFAYMIGGLGELEYHGVKLSVDNSYQYGPVCVDRSVRGSGVLEAIFEFARVEMAKRYPVLVTFINRINTRSFAAHTRKLGLEVIAEFGYNGNSYYELAYDTARPSGNLPEFLLRSEIVDYDDPAVRELAARLSDGLEDDEAIAEACFRYVRDEVRHTGDHHDDITTWKASEVLRYKTGWCYAKSHLLAALLRANGIPAGFCYQRFGCGEYRDDIHCLHGLNAVYLCQYGWYRVDPRGNKEGVDAQFSPPVEKLAFEPGEGEYDLADIYPEPLAVVVEKLESNRSYDAMIHDFPDIRTE